MYTLVIRSADGFSILLVRNGGDLTEIETVLLDDLKHLLDFGLFNNLLSRHHVEPISLN